MLKNGSDNSEKSAQSSRKDGPDVLIVVNATREQAEFWQERLTEDGIRGNGIIAGENAVILSVSEDNWKCAAGNALGTLNGFLLAARKAHGIGLLEDASEEDQKTLKEKFLEYCGGKSVFMYHTAGKGTRIAPLAGAEINSKSNLKLPEMLSFGGEWRTITILEESIKQTGKYAFSRKNRLCVFWGDQIIVNECDVDFDRLHHIEIFGRSVVLDKDIISYGVLVPRRNGDCLQREKLSETRIRSILPEGENRVYRSLGSFSVSLAFLRSLIDLEWKALQARGNDPGEIKSLNTDKDWWQPLTSSEREYARLMAEKGVREERSVQQWRKMNKLWSDFSGSDIFRIEKENSGVFRKVGYKDIGETSFWWDYGQNKHYFRNIRLLTENSEEAERARSFFGIDPGKWISKRCRIGEDAGIDNSIILDSKIGSGRIKNCVIIDSDIDSADLEDSIVIESRVVQLDLKGALCYNVVDEKISGRKGHMIVNIFNPEIGKITMRTSIYRNGEEDYKGGPEGRGKFVYDNLFTYQQINDLNAGVSIEGSKRTKQRYLSDKKNIEASHPEKFLAQKLSEKRYIAIPEARKIVALRMLLFGDIERYTPENYSEMFGIDIRAAETELKDLDVRVDETRDTSGDKNG